MQSAHCADALATTGFSRFPGVLQLWKQLCQDVSDACVLRDHIHHVMIEVGKKSFTQPRARTDAQPAPPRILPEHVQPFAPVPVDLEQMARRWRFEGADKVLDWLLQLAELGAPIRMISWFQLSILFEFQTGLPGIENRPSSKRYFMADQATRKGFVKITNQLSRWIQGIFGDRCKVQHVRPYSSFSQFWTMSVPMAIRPAWHELAENLLTQQQPTFSQVRDLRHTL